jgi:hypothetical protein
MYEYNNSGTKKLSEDLAQMANAKSFPYSEFYDFLNNHFRDDFKKLVGSKGMSPHHFGSSMKNKRIKFQQDNGKAKFEALVEFLQIIGKGKPTSFFEYIKKVDPDHFYFSFADFHNIADMQKEPLLQAIQGHYRSYKQSHEDPKLVSIGHVRIWESRSKALKVKETLRVKLEDGAQETREYNGYIWFRRQYGETEPLFWLDKETKYNFVRIIRLQTNEKANELKGTARYARERYEKIIPESQKKRQFFTKYVWLERITEDYSCDPMNFTYRSINDVDEKIADYIKFDKNRNEDVL